MTPKVLLVGWDAADWKVIQPLLDSGRMPHVRRIVEEGSSGNIATLHPPLSPMLWTSIATGKRPFKHGIHGFTEPTPDGRGIQPVTNLSRTTKAIWNILNQAGLRSGVVGWWPSHPAEPIDGVMVSDHFHRARQPIENGWPVLHHSVHPLELAGELAALRVHPDSLTPALVEPFIPLAREIDQDRDKRLGMFLRMLAECMSIHRVALHLLYRQPWDFFAVYFDSIDHFCHGFMRYHPPRQSWISERDFELYQHVVSQAYQLQDRMLGELMQKAGPDTNVILMSDHGFHPDHQRPSSIPNVPAGPAIEHRDLGILAMSGPAIRSGHPLYGASVLDITPTVLALFGLPVGEDMDGKVLSQVFSDEIEHVTIPSWEDVPGPDGRHPPHTRLDPEGAHAALEQMIALGYIQRPEKNRAEAVRKTLRELRYNLGESYQDAGRHAEAHVIFSELRAADPADHRFALRLFVSAQALGNIEEMRNIVEAAPPLPPSLHEWLRVQLLIAEGAFEEALGRMEHVLESLPPQPALLLQLAGPSERLRQWKKALALYQQVIALDPDNVAGHLGLSRVASERKQFQVGVDAALCAVQRGYQNPQAHYALGIALAGLSEYSRAAEALRTAISLNPNYPEAHLRLASLLDRRLNQPGAAREHRRLAKRLKTHAAVLEVDQAPQPARFDPVSRAVDGDMPPLEESLIVVTGIPRSGTSMLMQMLEAGGTPVLTDRLRAADEDNPRGYFEFEPVKGLFRDSNWLAAHKGKAVKIVAPLLAAIPSGLPCRVILCDRDLDEVLDSQERMLARQAASPGERATLKSEYARLLARVKANLAKRPCTRVLTLSHREVIANPRAAAHRLNQFLDGALDESSAATVVGKAGGLRSVASPAARA